MEDNTPKVDTDTRLSFTKKPRSLSEEVAILKKEVATLDSSLWGNMRSVHDDSIAISKRVAKLETDRAAYGPGRLPGIPGALVEPLTKEDPPAWPHEVCCRTCEHWQTDFDNTQQRYRNVSVHGKCGKIDDNPDYPFGGITKRSDGKECHLWKQFEDRKKHHPCPECGAVMYIVNTGSVFYPRCSSKKFYPRCSSKKMHWAGCGKPTEAEAWEAWDGAFEGQSPRKPL